LGPAAASAAAAATTLGAAAAPWRGPGSERARWSGGGGPGDTELLESCGGPFRWLEGVWHRGIKHTGGVISDCHPSERDSKIEPSYR
jgi:hypothetical protein